MPKFIVMEKGALTPLTWKWEAPDGYRKVAVVEITDEYARNGWRPKMISERAKGVIRVVRIWDRLYQGKTERSEYHRALKAANQLAADLNKGFNMYEQWPGQFDEMLTKLRVEKASLEAKILALEEAVKDAAPPASVTDDAAIAKWEKDDAGQA